MRTVVGSRQDSFNPVTSEKKVIKKGLLRPSSFEIAFNFLRKDCHNVFLECSFFSRLLRSAFIYTTFFGHLS
jgi:hypothetical protein